MDIRYDDLLKATSNLDAIEVAKDYIDIHSIDSYGRALALCPFHSDNNIGSFYISSEKGFKCFGCDKKGHIANVVAEVSNISFFQALRELGIKYGIISEGDKIITRTNEKEHNRRLQEEPLDNKKKISEVYENKPITKRCTNKGTKVVNKKLLDFVYRSVLDNLTLTDSHRHQLEEIRKINRGDIDFIRFKSLSQGQNISTKVIKDMKKEGIPMTELKGVPGFFQIKGRNKNNWLHINFNGIIIPIRDIDGYIVALQLRLDSIKKNQQRYLWFSSSFADGSNLDSHSINGSGIGSPLSVMAPTSDKIAPTIFITEGVFKSQKIVEHFSSYSISVQGITNWRGIEKVIRKIDRKLKANCNIVIAFDSDYQNNLAVLNQINTLKDTLTVEFPVKTRHDLINIISWDKFYSGIDDLINVNKQDTIKIVSEEELRDTQEYLEGKTKNHKCTNTSGS